MGSGDGNPPGPQVSRCCQIRAPSQGTCLEISRMKTSSPPRQNRSHLVAQVSELMERCLLVLLVHTAASTPAPQESVKPTPRPPLVQPSPAPAAAVPLATCPFACSARAMRTRISQSATPCGLGTQRKVEMPQEESVSGARVRHSRYEGVRHRLDGQGRRNPWRPPALTAVR